MRKEVLAKSAKIAPDSICRHSELRSAANAKSVAGSCKRDQIAAMKSLERTSAVICALQNHTRNAMTSEMIITEIHDKPCAIFTPKCIKYAVLGLPRTAPQTPRRYSAERRRFELFAPLRILRELDMLASTRKGGVR